MERDVIFANVTMLSSVQDVFNICASSSQIKNSHASSSDWQRLMESFSNGDCIRSPISSPPDIFCSSSGSSDTDVISRSRALHRVVTRLDFDSCVVQSSNTCRHFRARVSRSVINVESGDSVLHPPEVSVLEGNGGQVQIDVTSINPEVGVLEDDVKGQLQFNVTSISPQTDIKENPQSCSDRKSSKQLICNLNMTNGAEFHLPLSTDHVLGTGSDKDLMVSSPIIGRQKLSPQERSFCYRNRRKKRRIKVNDALQEVVLCQEHTSPAFGSHSSDRKDLNQLNHKTETAVHLRNDMRLTVISKDLSHVSDRNEMSLVSSPQQNKTSQSNVVSPVMKCFQRWRKRKRSVKIPHLGKNCCDVQNKPDQSRLQVNDDVIKDGYTDANVSTVVQILTPSPVLGRSSETKLRRAFIMMTAKSENSIHDEKLQDLGAFSNGRCVPFCDFSISDAPQRNDLCFDFDNNYPVTLEEDRKTEDDKGLKESQKCENYDVSGVGAEVAYRIKEDVKVSKESKCSDGNQDSLLFLSQHSIEADVTVETECRGIDITKCVRPSSSEVGKVLIDDVQCGSRSVRVDSDGFFTSNSSCRTDSVLLKGRQQKCNAEMKEESPDGVMSNDLLIETETSLDISMINTSEHRNVVAQDKVSVISSPSSPAPSCEVDVVISSCSTPKSDKVSALTHRNQETSCEDGVNLYMDSAKKKRGLRLNKSGLAARLQKLMSRVQSSRCMWQHEANHSNVLRSGKRGTLLNVHSVWTEYSNLLLHCSTSSCTFVSLQSSEDSDSSRSDVTMQIIVVLDPALHIHVKPQSTIRIYPPWQRLNVPHLNVTLILGVICVEEVQSLEKNNCLLSSLIKSQQQVTEMLYMCPCSCLQDLNEGKKCQFHFPLNGLEFLDHLLPQNVSMGALQCKATGGVHIPNTHCSVWKNIGTGTIAEVVVNQGYLIAEDICLQLFVLQVFQYKSRHANKATQNDATSNTISWSILGCDTAGEYCEVVLGPSPSSTQVSPTWTRIMTRQVIGHFYRFTGFTVMKRIHRTKGPVLWSFITKCKEQFSKQNLNKNKEMKSSELSESSGVHCNLGEEQILSEAQSLGSAGGPVYKELKNGLCKSESMSQRRNDINMAEHGAAELETSVMKGQLFIYVFSPGADCWEMEQLETVPCSHNVSVPVSQLSCLALLLSASDGCLARYTCLAKLLYITDDHMYLTDSSLGHVGLPGYVIMSVKPSCVVPSQIRDNKAVVVLLQDIQVDRGKLIADKYSWLTCVSNMDTRRETHMWLPVISDDDLKLISSVQVVLPNFTLTSTRNELVAVTGTVTSVDEETAFSWPVCGICENDLLVELGPNEYLCQNCDSASQTLTKMSLEVFISCPQFPESCKVRLKLQQASILSMLPTSQDNSQGYELSSVLGRAIGPVCCVVMRAGVNSFVLNEIPMLQ